MSVDPVVILGLVAAIVLVTIVGVIALEWRGARVREKQVSSIAAVYIAPSAGSSAGADCGAASGSGSCS